MDSSERNSLPYLAPLDGIRAIAILAVLIFHICPAALTGGFTGVDVFFVLSGFLITSIMLHDIQQGGFSLKEFYLRRIQRLLPNVIVTVLAVLVLWGFLMPPGAAVQPGVHGLWTLFNFSNVYIFKNLGGYWGAAAEWAPLTHFWSLGIEEQFYLLFPSVLLVITRFQSTRIRFWLIAATALSFAICLYGSYTHPLATFYLLPTRVWELLLGAVIAAHRGSFNKRSTLLRNDFGIKAREAMGWAGIGMILGGFILIDGSSKFPGWVSLAPTLGTVILLLSVVDGKTRVSQLLSAPFMVGTGKLSYSLYLWHWPLITFGKMQAELSGRSQLAGAAIGGLCGILLGWAAYVGIERPFRKRGPGRTWRLATIASGFVVVVLCCKLATRYTAVDPNHRFDTPTYRGELYNAGKAWDRNLCPDATSIDLDLPPLPARPNDSWRAGGVIHPYGKGQPKVVVLGSSHALMYSRLIDDICGKNDLSVAFFGIDGSSVFFENETTTSFRSPSEGHEFDETRRKWMKEWHPETIILIERWDRSSEAPQGFATKLRLLLKEVCPLAKRVIFVTQVPVLKVHKQINLRGFITWNTNSEGLPHLHPDINESFRKQATSVAETLLTEFPNLRVLRADQLFYRENGSIQYEEGRNFLYVDADHLTDAGSEKVRGLFQTAIAEAHLASSF
jgi:peptidoglycan/LPS O-acetylase OafA/YrhL